MTFFSSESSLKKTAVFWIRDGVLIDRMPVNAVAFAIASLVHAENARNKPSLATLVNFAFETSGVSCAEKMHRFNTQCGPLVADVDAAARYYQQLADAAGQRCNYFEYACEVLQTVQSMGGLNFITSAVNQDALDRWASTEQGRLSAPYLTEILGKRSDSFTKGRDHFSYVREKYAIERMIYVADAASELATGHTLSKEFNISLIGFAPEFEKESVTAARQMVLEEMLKLSQPPCSTADLSLDLSQLHLPGAAALKEQIQHYDAQHVHGDPKQIMRNVLHLFV